MVVYMTCVYYRYCSDPHSLDTINRFHESIDWASSGSFTVEDVEEAKLSVFSQVEEGRKRGGEGGRREEKEGRRLRETEKIELREAEGSTYNDNLKVSPSLSLRLMLQCLLAQEVVTISYEG